MMNQSKISHTQSIWCSSNGNTQTSPATFFFLLVVVSQPHPELLGWTVVQLPTLQSALII